MLSATAIQLALEILPYLTGKPLRILHHLHKQPTGLTWDGYDENGNAYDQL